MSQQPRSALDQDYVQSTGSTTLKMQELLGPASSTPSVCPQPEAIYSDASQYRVRPVAASPDWQYSTVPAPPEYAAQSLTATHRPASYEPSHGQSPVFPTATPPTAQSILTPMRSSYSLSPARQPPRDRSSAQHNLRPPMYADQNFPAHSPLPTSASAAYNPRAYTTPLYPPQSSDPNHITQAGIALHLYTLLHPRLADWPPTDVTRFTTRIAMHLIRIPLSSYEEIMMRICHAGRMHYLALVVIPPGGGDVQIMLSGVAKERDGADPLFDDVLMGMLERGFRQMCEEVWRGMERGQ
ncbi:hypothetical protein P153DRAFT_433753 [Dothidotthia symphoricarpi CBS 119687]|uniref:Uncharacterized protein n=1 Tax=Dothidotthia symphoricarpi CBS 119687 TaxID=1392245 RepID=A0A6A6A667_9PLEO|nr:uncharacterized protein P153DRAFT_433753 [Dothidotthia symphoricarpi CBS 119687]KAF2126643.1 hypothetical protein P153DRAFT_433753 [Dothidotthia symphoricarpi CBS 119687]